MPSILTQRGISTNEGDVQCFSLGKQEEEKIIYRNNLGSGSGDCKTSIRKTRNHESKRI